MKKFLDNLKKIVNAAKNKSYIAINILIMVDFIFYRHLKIFKNSNQLFNFLIKYANYLSKNSTINISLIKSKTSIKNIFSLIWPCYSRDEYGQFVKYQKQRIFLNFKPSFFNNKIVGDIGCGNGALMSALSSYINHGYLYDKSKKHFLKFIQKNKK